MLTNEAKDFIINIIIHNMEKCRVSCLKQTNDKSLSMGEIT